MFRKAFILLLAVSLTVFSFISASADGLFGELARNEGADERLAVLDKIAEPVTAYFTTNLFSVEISQAYYEGNRIYVSYKARGSEIVIQDGLELSDDSYADIIAGEEVEQEDGSIIGWKECVVPDENAADTLTVSLVFSTSFESADMSTVSFTLNRNGYSRFLRGISPAGAYRAEAELFMGKVDLKGVVRLVSPEQAASWIAWQEGEEETGTDVIGCWNLYQNGEPVSVDLYGASRVNGTEEVIFEIMYPRMDDLSGLTLVPEYSLGGEKAEEAIALEPVVQ